MRAMLVSAQKYYIDNKAVIKRIWCGD